MRHSITLTIISVAAALTAFCTATVCVRAGVVNVCLGTVQNNLDSGPGSLRHALANATNGETITFCPDVVGTITLTTGELVISNSVTILGPGATAMSINGNYPNTTNRVFYINPGLVVTISGLTITNGFPMAASVPEASGGAIFNDHSTLTVSNCLITGNSAGNEAGGIYNAGSNGGSATLTVIDSTISRNLPLSVGGGILNDGGSGNATLTVDHCTLNGNSAGGAGGGVASDGQSGRAGTVVVNSTLSGNSAGLGGGLDNLARESSDGGIQGTATVTVVNCTFNGNSGGSIHNRKVGGDATVEIGSTILNGGLTISNDAATVISLGYNLSSDNGGGFLTASGDQTDANPLLGPLQNNGGPTFTHALACGSSAHDAGFDFSGSATDQRGFPRTFDDPLFTNAPGGDGTDIGSFELPQDTTPPTINCPGDITVSSDAGQCGATVNLSVTASDDCGSVTAVCSPLSGSFFGQGTTKVICTATDYAGNTNSCSFNVTVTQPANCGITVSGNSGGATTVCPGNSVVLTAPNGMKHYLWTGPEQNGSTLQTIVVTTPGTYHCSQDQYYGPTSCCSVTISNYPTPPCNITGDLLITNGLPTTLVGPDGMLSQYWTGPQNNGLGSRSNTVSLAGTYQLHLTDSNGCQTVCSVVVTNRTPAPCSITASGDAGGLTICSGRKTTLTAANGMASYLWSGPEQNGATSKSIIVGTQGTYTVQQIDYAGLTNACSVFLTVHPLPPAAISGTLTFCQGTNTTLSGPDGMVGYTWLGPQHNGLNAQSNTVSLAGTYTLIVTDSNGCQNAQSVPVTTVVCP